ncbi:hypothetical protein NC796_01660 [Aliifodinibius sp. S!AR15-10]|nr:hypothetical protein [Aliifodinibius sp. S!AR15-10]MDR8389824.1 hypothetical protein [Aliifodinibius sp. S!AR15-10]
MSGIDQQITAERNDEQYPQPFLDVTRDIHEITKKQNMKSKHHQPIDQVSSKA